MRTRWVNITSLTFGKSASNTFVREIIIIYYSNPLEQVSGCWLLTSSVFLRKGIRFNYRMSLDDG